MTLEELIKHLRGLGLSEDTIKGMVSCYDFGYAQGLIDSQQKQTSNEKDKE